MSTLALLLLTVTGPWITDTDTGAITIWYRDAADGSAREIKAEGTVDAPPEQVWAVLDAPEKYLEFMPYLEELRVLERFAGGRYQYERINPPVVSRRDYTLEVRSDVDAAKRRYRLTWKPADARGPAPVEDVVRVVVNEGSWLVEPAGTGSKLTYHLTTHPGGSIPSWIAKRANAGTVPDLFKAVSDRCAALAPRKP